MHDQGQILYRQWRFIPAWPGRSSVAQRYTKVPAVRQFEEQLAGNFSYGPPVRGDVQELLLGVGILFLVALWIALTAVIAASFYLRNSLLDALGLPAMAILSIASLLPLVGICMYADRVRAHLRERY